MSYCAKCWYDAYRRTLDEPMKCQAEHYRDLLNERFEKPCTIDEQMGVRKEQND